MQARTQNIPPRWLRIPQAIGYSGIGERTLEKLISSGQVVSAHVLLPGNTRGVRLIDRQSLDAFIESAISNPPADLVMNRKEARP
jgi:hypothetical protein